MHSSKFFFKKHCGREKFEYFTDNIIVDSLLERSGVAVIDSNICLFFQDEELAPDNEDTFFERLGRKEQTTCSIECAGDELYSSNNDGRTLLYKYVSVH